MFPPPGLGKVSCRQGELRSERKMSLKPQQSVLTSVTSTLGRVKALMTGEMMQNPTEDMKSLGKKGPLSSGPLN